MSEGVKCLVWDLDNTLWRGTLLESDTCRLRPGVREVIAELDRRGVLQSVASRNEPSQALQLLRRRHLEPFFLHPQIGWDSKVQSVKTIARRLGLALDAMALIDDEPFEREQVCAVLPGVRTYPAEVSASLPTLPEFLPAALSEESRCRRETYRGLDARERASRASGMSQGEFLRRCHTELTLRPALPADLPRVQELLQRTHQLNANGLVWPPDAVARWLDDPDWRVFVAELRDRFVAYGRIGVAACQRAADGWELLTFLLSCRVLGRGIAGYFLAWVRHQAQRDGAAAVAARYRPGPRNHLMEQLFRLAGLEAGSPAADGTRIFRGASLAAVTPPRWLIVHDGGMS